MTARRLALVTGGTSGIGLAIARSLLPDHDLALAYASNHERAGDARRQLAVEKAGEVRIYPGRLLNYHDAETLVRAVRADFDRPPAVLVSCAGGVHDRLFLRSDFARQLELVGEHLVVPMALARLLLEDMYRRRFGRILLLSSIGARYAKRGQCVYAAAKAGLEGFTRALALEVAHRGVTVNAVAPGLIETPMTEELLARWSAAGVEPRHKIAAGRVGRPEEVAHLARFLCSEEAGYITGTVQVVDGGRSLGDLGS